MSYSVAKTCMVMLILTFALPTLIATKIDAVRMRVAEDLLVVCSQAAFTGCGRQRGNATHLRNTLELAPADAK